MADDEPIPTRASLLSRLRDLKDDASWSEFNRTYRGLIFGVARRAGLTETEAQEVVQDTLLAVAKKMPTFHYRPGADSFKGWLLQLTRWRINDQPRRRARVALARIKRQVRPEHCEIYHLRVMLGRPVADVRRVLGVRAAQVYLATHRVGAALKREVRRLEAEWG